MAQDTLTISRHDNQVIITDGKNFITGKYNSKEPFTVKLADGGGCKVDPTLTMAIGEHDTAKIKSEAQSGVWNGIKEVLVNNPVAYSIEGLGNWLGFSHHNPAEPPAIPVSVGFIKSLCDSAAVVR